MEKKTTIEMYGILIETKNVLYITVSKKCIRYFLYNGEVIEQKQKGQIKTMASMLKSYGFILHGTTYILNTKYIKQQQENVIFLTNGTVLLT